MRGKRQRSSVPRNVVSRIGRVVRHKAPASKRFEHDALSVAKDGDVDVEMVARLPA
jgi:hypothetical protein